MKKPSWRLLPDEDGITVSEENCTYRSKEILTKKADPIHSERKGDRDRKVYKRGFGRGRQKEKKNSSIASRGSKMVCSYLRILA